MAITSESKTKRFAHLKSAQFRYAAIYIIITFVALLVLNIYSSKSSQELFFNNKKASMIDKCKLAADRISFSGEMTGNAINDIFMNLDDMDVTRVVVTDKACLTVYDTNMSIGTTYYVLYPEIITALEGNDVFYWNYHDSAMKSTAATPIYAQGQLLGCVYMMDYDTAQGTLIATLQNSIFAVTIVLQIILIIFSFIFSSGYSRRLRKIMASIRTVQQGDYSHMLEISGHDELNTLSNEFNDLTKRLQISENKRSQFVTDASHELKTPLASIKLLSDSILQNNMDIDTIREFVGDIGAEAERLNRMSQKLLSLTKADTDVNEETEITDVAPVVKRIVHMLSENARDHAVEIKLTLDEMCVAPVSEDDLSQILFNLAENGIKYNKKGGILSISVAKLTDMIEIIVSDTGIGIPEDSLSHIFERFYRVDKARSRSTGGSGLGLSIVRSMVERNHGVLQVESAFNAGTTFTLRFPAAEHREVQQ